MIIELDLPLNRERLDVTLTECLQELGHKLTRSDITKALNCLLYTSDAADE